MFSLSLGNSSSKYFDYTTMRKPEAKRMCAGSVIARELFVLVLAIAFTGCAAFQPTNVNGPTANLPPYPIGQSEMGNRLEEASQAWYQLSQHSGLPDKTEAHLNPYTATLESLPANLPAPIYLPKVGSQTNPTEEQMRESLRRFIVEWQRLIGADPNQLSLVERTDEPSGVKLARYEQRAFRYPLRGGFGNLTIRFRSDWQLVSFSSNCIPNADRIQATLNTLTPKVTSEQAVNHIKTQPSLPANATVEARQLVVYALPSKDPSNGLQIRLAWELEVTGGPVTRVYLDAISDEIIATS